MRWIAIFFSLAYFSSADLVFGATSAPSFTQFMYGNPFYAHNQLKDVKEWEKAFISWNGNIKKSTSKNYLIPEKIHIIWLSDAPMGPEIEEIVASWRRFHPEWELSIWTKEKIDQLPMVRKDLYNQSASLHEKFYIAQYEILYRFGGVTVDPQLECLKSFAELHKNYSFYASLWDLRELGIGSSLLGSARGHPLIYKTLRALSNSSSPFHYIKSYKEMGPVCLSRIYRSMMKKGDLNMKKSYIFPFGQIFPWPRYLRWMESSLARKNLIRSDSYTFYHWDKTE